MEKTLTDSQIYMWKTVIALIHADNVEHPEETNFIKDRMDKLQLNPEQRTELENTLQSPGSVEENFEKITDTRDRSQFIYFARLLFWSDGDFSKQERKIHQQLNENVIGKANLRKVMRRLDDIKAEVKEWEDSQKQDQPLHRRIINTLDFWDDLDVAD